jgi:hypothetical protein
MKKIKLLLVLLASIMVLTSGECNDEDKPGTEKANDPKEVMGNLSEENYYCKRFSGVNMNPGDMVSWNLGTLVVKVTGKSSQFEQIVYFENSTSPYATHVDLNNGTTSNNGHVLYADGCVRVEVPKNEDYNIKFTFIEGCDATGLASGQCYRWETSLPFGQYDLDQSVCNTANEMKVSVWNATPTSGSCTY